MIEYLFFGWVKIVPAVIVEKWVLQQVFAFLGVILTAFTVMLCNNPMIVRDQQILSQVKPRFAYVSQLLQIQGFSVFHAITVNVS